MSLTNPNSVVTEERLSDFYQGILPYLGGMPDILANKFNKSDLYDINTEKTVGRWVDGRCLYQKVYTDSQYMPINIKSKVKEDKLGSGEKDSTLKALIPNVLGQVSNASASSVYASDAYLPWHAFDGNANDDWSCAKNDNDTWLQWTFDYPKYIKNFSIINTRSHGDRDIIPKVQLQGLNAYDEWEILYESEPNTTTFTITEAEIDSNKQDTLYFAVRFKQFRTNTNNLAYIGDFKVNGYDEIQYTFIQYTKTTDAPNSCIIGLDTDYSTTEKIVGTWIDGKPIYQKTISKTHQMKNNGAWRFDVPSNVDKFVDTTVNLILHIDNNDIAIIMKPYYESDSNYIMVNSDNLYIKRSILSENIYYTSEIITYQYTKTTD